MGVRRFREASDEPVTVQTNRTRRSAEIEARERELRATRYREQLLIEPKALRALLRLIHHAEHRVTKKELFDAY